jgi:hypothetical protein
MKRRCDKPDGHEERLFDRILELESDLAGVRAAMKPIIERLEEVRAKDEAGWLLPDEWIDVGRAALRETQ